VRDGIMGLDTFATCKVYQKSLQVGFQKCALKAK